MKAVRYAVLAMALVTLLAMIPMGESDAATGQISIDHYEEDPFFDTMNGGSLVFYLQNDGGEIEVTATVTAKETGNVLKTEVETVPAATAENPLYKFVISMGGYKSEGEHQINVTFTDENGDSVSKDMIIDVEENIMSNWTTFVVIIVVVVIIAIIIFMKMRDSQSKKSANTMTFEELEALRKAEMAAKSEKKAPKQPTSTERRKYNK